MWEVVQKNRQNTVGLTQFCCRKKRPIVLALGLFSAKPTEMLSNFGEDARCMAVVVRLATQSQKFLRNRWCKFGAHRSCLLDTAQVHLDDVHVFANQLQMLIICLLIVQVGGDFLVLRVFPPKENCYGN